MTNKEDLKELKDAFLTIKQEWLEDRNVKLTEWQKKVFDSIEKDLEELEKYRKVMCEPIFDIMKKLKLLYILKENIKLIDYCIYNDKIVIYLPVYYREELKEWLDEK